MLLYLGEVCNVGNKNVVARHFNSDATLCHFDILMTCTHTRRLTWDIWFDITRRNIRTVRSCCDVTSGMFCRSFTLLVQSFFGMFQAVWVILTFELNLTISKFRSHFHFQLTVWLKLNFEILFTKQKCFTHIWSIIISKTIFKIELSLKNFEKTSLSSRIWTLVPFFSKFQSKFKLFTVTTRFLRWFLKRNIQEYSPQVHFNFFVRRIFTFASR